MAIVAEDVVESLFCLVFDMLEDLEAHGCENVSGYRFQAKEISELVKQMTK